jgi:hypothetical protein
MSVHDGPMAPTTYSDVLARNIRAARSRTDLGQEAVAERMQNLGFSAWIRQTVGSTERGRRRPTGEEILGLAICLETTAQRLMTPLSEDKWVELPSGESLRVGAVVSFVTGQQLGDVNTRDVQWYGNVLARAIVPPHEGEAAFSRDTPEGEG